MSSVNLGEENSKHWLALVIGNSRLHWAWLESVTPKRTILRQSWNTPHLSTTAVDRLIQHKFDFNQLDFNQWGQGFDPAINSLLLPALPYPLPLWIASVVPDQTQLWQAYAGTQVLHLNHIPLQGKYPTMGIDRALSLWGAIHRLPLPVLVIDAGTALTFSGADATGQFVGGAILPGLGLQCRSLSEHTAALPALSQQLAQLRSIEAVPPRWAIDTPDAMISGVLYTLLAGLESFMQSWMQDYPNSTVVLTGGDGSLLLHHWQQYYGQQYYGQHYSSRPDWSIQVEPNLVFWGMQTVVAQRTL